MVGKRKREGSGGAPSIYNKGPISNAIRDAADALLIVAQNGECVLCGLSFQRRAYDGQARPFYNRDHVIARSVSHDDSIFNTRLTHQRCNHRKAAKPLTPEQQDRVDASAVILRQALAGMLGVVPPEGEDEPGRPLNLAWSDLMPPEMFGADRINPWRR